MHDSLLYQSRFVDLCSRDEDGVYFVAYNILESIDENVDPCENFYQFTCGAWIRNAARQSESKKIFVLPIYPIFYFQLMNRIY